MIDLAAIRQAYQRREIEGIAHVPGAENPADAMTKVVKSGRLMELMEGKSTAQASQWVVRKEVIE